MLFVLAEFIFFKSLHQLCTPLSNNPHHIFISLFLHAQRRGEVAFVRPANTLVWCGSHRTLDPHIYPPVMRPLIWEAQSSPHSQQRQRNATESFLMCSKKQVNACMSGFWYGYNIYKYQTCWLCGAQNWLEVSFTQCFCQNIPANISGRTHGCHIWQHEKNIK